MYEYIFLFVIGIIWLIFATVQDLKIREVANWLNFSLVCMALIYRLFYSIQIKDYSFFFIGLLGVFVFYLLSQLFYYSRFFGGGDAKLLVGFGALLPISNFKELLIYESSFILLLLFVGAGYSLIATLFFAFKNKNKFIKSLKEGRNNINWKFYVLLFLIVYFIVGFGYDWVYGLYFFILLLFLLLLFLYLKAVEKSCMHTYVKPRNLREGDWLGEKIEFKGIQIGKSVHGLSIKDIKSLIKRNKNVLIKQGVPFVPVFLIVYLIMLFVFFSEVDILQLFQKVFQF